MTEQEFQKKVLQSLQILDEIRRGVSELKDQVTTLEIFTEGKWKEKEEFDEKLFVVVENEIVDRLKGENDVFKGYTDKKVHTHEVKFRHEAVA